METEIRRLTPERADDFFRFFEKVAFADHSEWGGGCYCCYYHAESFALWEKRTPEQNRETARNLILAGRMRGLLAYSDGKPVGWCHFDGKTDLPGLKAMYPQVMGGDDEKAGAIVCFTVAQGYRNRGIASRLLARACEELKIMGYTAAEGYPAKGCADDEHNYVGPLSMYLAQGFTVVKELENESIVRKALTFAG